MNWGVTPLVIPFNYEIPEKTIELAMKTLIARGDLKRGQTAVVISSISAGEKFIDAIEMRTIE